LRLLGQAVETFEKFVTELGHDMYFVEPLYYHNAVIFERYGFTYQMGKRLMNSIHQAFNPAVTCMRIWMVPPHSACRKQRTASANARGLFMMEYLVSHSPTSPCINALEYQQALAQPPIAHGN
jgi:hypothetical protein